MDTQPSAHQTSEQKLRGIRCRKLLLALCRWLPLTLTVLVIAALICAAAFIPFPSVYGSSMSPTLADGDLCIALPEQEYRCGDIIAFSRGGKTLIRRIIAGPGSTVSMDESGAVTVDGVLLTESYLESTALGQCNISFPYTVPDNQYFVMGDNRETSVDSRSTALGCVLETEIIGKLYARLWPFSSFCRSLYDET